MIHHLINDLHNGLFPVVDLINDLANDPFPAVKKKNK